MSEYADKVRMNMARDRIDRIEAVLGEPEIRAALSGKDGDAIEVLELVQSLFIKQEAVFSDRWLKAVVKRHNREAANDANN